MTSTDDIERDPAARNSESGAGERESGVIEVRVGVEGAATAALMTSTDDVERDPAARSGESGAGKRESGVIEVRGGVEGATTAALMTSTDNVERGPAARSRESRVGKRESKEMALKFVLQALISLRHHLKSLGLKAGVVRGYHW